MMIVDDRYCIIGSANINDRRYFIEDFYIHFFSLCGDRDSEIAVCIKDEKTVSSKMNGKEYSASNFAHDLRVKLWLEHLGIYTSTVKQIAYFKDWTRHKKTWYRIQYLTMNTGRKYQLKIQIFWKKYSIIFREIL